MSFFGKKPKPQPQPQPQPAAGAGTTTPGAGGERGRGWSVFDAPGGSEGFGANSSNFINPLKASEMAGESPFADDGASTATAVQAREALVRRKQESKSKLKLSMQRTKQRRDQEASDILAGGGVLTTMV